MGRYRFVDPELQRVPLTDDDWVEVNKDINFKDAMNIARLREAGENVKALAAMIVNWSFVDRDGKTPIPVSEDAIANLDQETAVEVTEAITDAAEAREQEKKLQRAAIEPVAQSQ